MVRILSGGQDGVGSALLRGTQMGAAWGSARRANEAARADEERRQMAAMLEIQKTKMRLDTERAKALEEANKRAAMGDAQAFKVQEMERMLQDLPPDKKRMVEGLQLRKRLAEGGNDDAIKLFDETFQQMEQEIKLNQGYEAASGEIERAVKDGLLDETTKPTFDARLMAKRSKKESADDLLTELGQARVERATLAANIQENTEYVEQIDAAIQAMPPGRARKLALIAANEYKASPSKLEEEGSGPEILALVQKIGLGSAREYEKREQAKRDKMQARLSPQARAPGLGGMTAGERTQQLEKEPNFLGLGGPKVPPLDPGFGTKTTKKKGGTPRAVDPKNVERAVSALVEETRDPKELAKRLQEQGIPLTQEVLAAARAALQGRRTRAQASGGADR